MVILSVLDVVSTHDLDEKGGRSEGEGEVSLTSWNRELARPLQKGPRTYLDLSEVRVLLVLYVSKKEKQK